MDSIETIVARAKAILELNIQLSKDLLRDLKEFEEESNKEPEKQ